MGIALRAVDSAIGRTVVIKTIRLGELTDPVERKRLRDRLFHEARSAGMVSHPGIVTIYDVAEEGELAYIAMEFVNGPTLDQLLSREQPLEPATLFRILRETAAALDFAHKKGIVHRDIKPANIMIHEDGTVKITDFGVAKISASQLATQAGVVLGTPSYMSPEQALGKPVDGRSDQFSLAVIAYEMLAGERPFVAEELASLVYKIAHAGARPLAYAEPPIWDGRWRWCSAGLWRKVRRPAFRVARSSFRLSKRPASPATGWAPIPRGHGQNLPTLPLEVAVEPSPEPAPPVPPATVDSGGRRKTVVVAGAVRDGHHRVYQHGADMECRPAAAGFAAPSRRRAARGRLLARAPQSGRSGIRQAGTADARRDSGGRDRRSGNQARTSAAPTQPSSGPPASAAATVMLRTSPPGASVILDDSPQLACTSPLLVVPRPGQAHGFRHPGGLPARPAHLSRSRRTRPVDLPGADDGPGAGVERSARSGHPGR